jgi:hypothetical protein
MKLRAVPAALSILAGTLGGQVLAADTPRAIAEKFCATRLDDDEKALRSLLTPSLLEAISEAEARNDIIAKASPDEKPPFGDGIPYQTFPDAAPVCEIGAAKQVEGRTEIEVRYLFPGNTSGADWTDRLVLIEAEGRLLIDNVVFETAVNDTDEISLRSLLFNAFDQ